MRVEILGRNGMFHYRSKKVAAFPYFGERWVKVSFFSQRRGREAPSFILGDPKDVKKLLQEVIEEIDRLEGKGGE